MISSSNVLRTVAIALLLDFPKIPLDSFQRVFFKITVRFIVFQRLCGGDYPGNPKPLFYNETLLSRSRQSPEDENGLEIVYKGETRAAEMLRHTVTTTKMDWK